jgi:glutamyl/glutaminyl-tRNA synthetase
LCVTHDDALQGVTLITRGIDLKPATHLHRLLQALMGWPAPAYAHHPLLTDASGRRLAKRDRAMTLRELRAQGLSPESVRFRISAEPSPLAPCVMIGVSPGGGDQFRTIDGPDPDTPTRTSR